MDCKPEANPNFFDTSRYKFKQKLEKVKYQHSECTQKNIRTRWPIHVTVLHINCSAWEETCCTHTHTQNEEWLTWLREKLDWFHANKVEFKGTLKISFWGIGGLDTFWRFLLNSPVLQFGAPPAIDSGEAKMRIASWEILTNKCRAIRNYTWACFKWPRNENKTTTHWNTSI